MTVSEYRRSHPVLSPIAPDNVEILADPAFDRSCREVRRRTLLDTPRLANLWSLCQRCDPSGAIIEVGAYRGGGALHLSNSAPDRRIVVCDSFAGFDNLHEDFDTTFGHHMFGENRPQDVERLFTRRHRDALILAGFFPDSAEGLELGPFSFAHVDVDVYKGTKDTLEYLHPRMLPRSLIVLDDVNRCARGVDQAISEFTRAHRDWLALPLFPAQGLLIHRGWFAT